MKSIFGRINRIGKLNNELFNEALNRLADCPHKKIEKEISDLFGFVQVLFKSEPELSFFSTPDYFIVADCRIDNKKELLEKLQIRETDISDDLVILKTYENWGTKCTEYLLGDFAFAIWNKKKKELFCARDHFGVKPFYYYFDEDNFVFGSEIKVILSQNDIQFSIDEQYIADSLSVVKSENNRTTYLKIKKLPPAHFLILKNNQLEIREYWKLSIQKELELDKSQIIEQFKDLLFKAVECRVTKDGKTGAELSGGLDSSSVAAIASLLGKIKTFSHIMPEDVLGKIHPLTDEREFIYLLNDFCGIRENFFVTSDKTPLLDTLSYNVKEFKYIEQQSFSTFSDNLYAKAQTEGVLVLLSGFGGDEVVSSKSESYLIELAQLGLWKELMLDLKDQKLSQIRLFIKLLKYFLKVKCTKGYNFFVHFKSRKTWWQDKFENLALNNMFSEKMKIKERYFLQFEKIDKMTLQEKNIHRVMHSHVSQRLEDCSIAARKYGIEYRYPLLDKRLIEFYLSIPIRLKARNGQNRFAIREAMKNVLPEKIRLRNDKSGTAIPTVFMRMLNDKNKIIEIISRSKGNEKTTKYIEFEKFNNWFNLMLRRSEEYRKDINPGTFYNYLKLILFIEQNPSLFE